MLLKLSQRLSRTIQCMLQRPCSSMAGSVFAPPAAVKGMTEFDAGKFDATVNLPVLRVPAQKVGRILGLKVVQDCFLKGGSSFKRVINGENKDEKICVFDPEKLSDPNRQQEIKELTSKVLAQDLDIEFKEFRLSYSDWDVKKCLRAVLPDNLDFSSHTQTGHILHLNLREELLPFRFVIARILIDKIPYAKTIVNKTDAISSEFRVFELELLAGEPNYVAVVQECGHKYQLDFSKVFWNSRLMNEHKRIVEKIRASPNGVVLFDAFAGIGPFAIPAAFSPNTLRVYANDLNQVSVTYLEKNIALNRVKKEKIHVFNLDAAEFIRRQFPVAVLNELNDAKDQEQVEFHVVMNLPAIAVTFLPNFHGCLKDIETKLQGLPKFTVHVHVHCFPKAEEDQPAEWFRNRAQSMVEEQLPATQIRIEQVHFVRNVAGRKDMYCVSFQLQHGFMFDDLDAENGSEVARKRAKLAET